MAVAKIPQMDACCWPQVDIQELFYASQNLSDIIFCIEQEVKELACLKMVINLIFRNLILN